jgi:hypothetical protein
LGAHDDKTLGFGIPPENRQQLGILDGSIR